MPSDRSMRAMNAIHRFALKISGGKLGWNLGGMTVLELTTIGRKSGQPRSTMLTVPLREGSTFVVVASKGGEDTHPAWFLNLRDNPDVEVVIEGAPPTRAHARVATVDERARMWPLITAKYANYAGYQEKTDREIPLVLIDVVK
jgi:deazaflavin-dependent oxidoreductase (nitroreductase family)